MLTVIYRWRIRSGQEEAFRQAWREVTSAIHEQRGSLGSRLHRAVDGTWVAYAQWPSREALERSRAQAPANPEASERMRACVEERFEELQLEVTDDLLAR